MISLSIYRLLHVVQVAVDDDTELSYEEILFSSLIMKSQLINKNVSSSVLLVCLNRNLECISPH